MAVRANGSLPPRKKTPFRFPKRRRKRLRLRSEDKMNVAPGKDADLEMERFLRKVLGQET